ncbi:snake venom 5'-nucleotidase-like [Dermacentor variabilis]|uniref:snake venom 5'-nucleotidase-like n=1 Tax=Dermacentor variabilis TaxID=34621 RepID=UPI003F5CA892
MPFHTTQALGVHEFDRGTADLRTYLNAMENEGVPVVLCNVDVRREPRIESNATQPSRVLKFNNGTVSVGIIGYINPLTAFRSYPEFQEASVYVLKDVPSLLTEFKSLFQPGYTRLPFRVASAPAVFQREMNNLIRGMSDNGDHMQNLHNALAQLQDAGLKLKLEKPRLGTSPAPATATSEFQPAGGLVPAPVASTGAPPTSEAATVARGHTQFTNDIECVRREAQRLKKQGVNIIIALGHSGLEYDKRIAFEVPLVDIVVGGNSHYFMFSGSPLVDSPEPVYGPYPVVIQRPDGTQAVVVTAFWFGKYVGQLEVHFDLKGHIVGYEGFPVLMDSSIDVEADDRIYVSKLAESITTAREKADTDRNQPIGSTKVLLEGSRQRCRLEECSMGNLLTDALFNWYAGLLSEDDNLWGPVNGAILPGRDIFASIDERLTRGRILLQHVIEVLAFNDDVNHAFVITMPGRILQELLEGSMKEYDVTKRAPVTDFLQVSGIRVEYNVRRRPYHRVTRLQTVCTDCRVPTYVGVEPNKTYRYVVPQTMFNGSEMAIFQKLQKGSTLNTGG